MKLLSICIPNYNRLNCLKELVDSIIDQINRFGLKEDIEICVSDDFSMENPDDYMIQLQKDYPQLAICYQRNEKNKGMDYNFCKSVEIAHGKYSWIMGNDDQLLDGALKNVIDKLKNMDQSIDIIVTPFESYSYDGKLLDTFYPLGKCIGNEIYHMENKTERDKYFYSVKHNCGLFAFLSNVIFKRERWVEHGDMFQNKMNSIFIQVYMHMQTIMEGAVIWHLDEFITRNQMDDKPENKNELLYKITIGLYDVIDFFFEGDLKNYLWETIVAPWPIRKLLASDINDDFKDRLINMKFEAVTLLKDIFVFKENYDKVFKNKKVLIFGTGWVAKRVMDIITSYNIKVIGFCDNNKELWGEEKEGYSIISPDEIGKIYNEDTVIVIASSYYMEIHKQLKKLGEYKMYVVI